ncbi:MAG: ABC transporter ATP-binding protein [Roseinatronobacter sp.]
MAFAQSAETLPQAQQQAAASDAAATRRMPPLVRFEKVTVTYGSGAGATLALSETSLDIPTGDFVALVGPSGCGKSTLLRIAGDLMRPTSGHVFLRGREIGAVPVRLGMAYQSASMLPWLTVRANVMLPLRIVQPFRAQFRAKRRGEFRDRVDSLLAQVGLLDFAEKFPWQLSGGMLQRANLCRAIVHQPELLLLDEPFGALDQFTKEELWQVLQDLWQDQKMTVLMVTHDLREAVYLANRVCVMSARPGRILEDCQVDFPRPRALDDTFTPDFVNLTQHLRARIIAVRTGTGPAASTQGITQ